MADDINVVFGADTTQLDAAVGKVKSEMQSLIPGAPGSGILTPLPFGMGGAPTTLFEKATVAAKANASAAAQAGTAMKNYGLELEEAGAKAGRAGINIGAMMERLAVRLVIFEALRLAIQGVKYVFDEVAKTQAVELRFTAMSSHSQHLSTDLEHLHDIAAKTFTPFDETVAVEQKFEDMGLSFDLASAQTERLNEWAHVLNTTSDKLADSLEHVSKGAGTLAEKREVATMLGDSAQAGMQLVRTLQSLEVTGPAVARSLDVVMQSLETMNRAEHQTIDQFKRDMGEYERHLERHTAFSEKMAQAEEKAGGGETAEEELTRKLEYARRATAHGEVMPTIRAHGFVIPKEELDEYVRGYKAYAQENNLTETQLNRLINERSVTRRDLLQMAKESTQDELRGGDEKLRQDDKSLEKAREDNRLGKEARDARLAGTKAEVAQLPSLIGMPAQAQWETFQKTPAGQQAAAATALAEAINKGNAILTNINAAADRQAASSEGLYALLAGGT